MFLQITKGEVDQFKPMQSAIPPFCLVELVWTGGEKVPPKRLCHKVTLKGARSNFLIRHDPQAIGGCNIMLYYVCLIQATLHLLPLLPLTLPFLLSPTPSSRSTSHSFSLHLLPLLPLTVSKHPSPLQLGEKGLELSYTALMFYKQIKTINVYLKLVIVSNLVPVLEVKFT